MKPSGSEIEHNTLSTPCLVGIKDLLISRKLRLSLSMAQLIPTIFTWFVEAFSNSGILFSKYSLLTIHLCSLKPYWERVG